MNHNAIDTDTLLAKAAELESRLGTKSLLGGIDLTQTPHRLQAWKQRPPRDLEYRIRKFDRWQEDLNFTDDVKSNRRKFNNISHRNKVAYKHGYRAMEIANFVAGNRHQMVVESMFHLRRTADVL